MGLDINSGNRAGTVPACEFIDPTLAQEIEDLRGALGVEGARSPIRALLIEALKASNAPFSFPSYR